MEQLHRGDSRLRVLVVLGTLVARMWTVLCALKPDHSVLRRNVTLTGGGDGGGDGRLRGGAGAPRTIARALRDAVRWRAVLRVAARDLVRARMHGGVVCGV